MRAAARRGRLPDTAAISFSLLLLLARSATHADGVTLSTVPCPLTTKKRPFRVFFYLVIKLGVGSGFEDGFG